MPGISPLDTSGGTKDSLLGDLIPIISSTTPKISQVTQGACSANHPQARSLSFHSDCTRVPPSCMGLWTALC